MDTAPKPILRDEQKSKTEKMGDEGLEPATNRLRVYCSTIELVARKIYDYSEFNPILQGIINVFSQNLEILVN